jgi:hypothetical protein
MRSLLSWRRDRRRLANTLIHLNPSRLAIAEAFLAFENESARLRYIRWVEIETAEPEKLRALVELPNNPWPPNGRPNIDDGEASTLLAQLDASWTGIDV